MESLQSPHKKIFGELEHLSSTEFAYDPNVLSPFLVI